MRQKSLARRLIPWFFAVLALAALVIFVGIPLYSQKEDTTVNPPVIGYYEGDGKPMTMENDRLLFEMDTATTQFTVTDKESGQVWRSNPADAAQDPVALSLNKDTLSSTLLVTYTTNSGIVDYNNYTYSIKNQNYLVHQHDDGSIRVDYSIGKIEKVYIIPTAITKARFDAFVANMSKSTKKKLSSNYTLYTPDKLESKDNKDELIAMYPSITTEELYILKSDTSTNNKAKIEGYFEEGGYTMADYELDSQLVAGKKDSSGPVFNVSVIYRLDGGDLVVEIPYSEIRYRADYPITYVSPLPMFGAAGTQDEGFMLIPEGGGALINFNNGKVSQSAYYANMYGWDYGTERLEVVSETENAFPVFGVSRKGEGSFICMMEGASAYGGVSADISGRYNSYNWIYGKYNVLHSGQYNVSAKTAQLVYMYEARIPDDTLVQRYRFLQSDSYVDMATAYGDYLREGNPLLAASKSSQEVPVHVEILGAIDKTEVKFGVPVKSSVAATTFDQAQTLAEDILSTGVKNLNIRFSGWANGGIRQRVLTSVHTEGVLGGDGGMKKLIAWAKEKNVPLTFDGISCFAYDSGIFNGFLSFSNAARFVTRELIQLYPYDIITYTQMEGKDPYYLVKPTYAQQCGKNLLAALKDRGADGVSFRDIGDLLSADYNPRDTVTREKVKAQNVEVLEQAKTNGQRVVIRKGNDYAVPYADLITDMNLSGQAYAIIDQRVPFYQIALHGMKDYTGDPINLARDSQEELLNTIEYGAGLNFTFMHANGKILQESDYSGYYSANYDAWKDHAQEVIARYQREMTGLNQLRITGHEALEGNVNVTTYENGTKVYVNYGDDPWTGEGVTVPARDYLVKGGEAQ